MIKRNIFARLPLLVLLLAAVACAKKDPNAPREDFIEVYDSPSCVEALNSTSIPVKGGTTTLYIKSNVAFKTQWQDGMVPAWARVDEPRRIGDDLWEIKVTADPISDDVIYERRSGVLMLTDSERYLGNFFVVNQGFVSRIACDFSWLTGSESPNETIYDILMENWNNLQKGKGFSSTLIPGQESAWVYSKAGYIKLGNNDYMGADLKTPRVSAFQNDSLLVVSFKAVVQNGPSIGDFYAETDPVTGDSDTPVPPGPGPDPGPDPGPGPSPEPQDGGSSSGTEPITPMASFPRAFTRATADVDNNTLTIEVIGGGVIRGTDQTTLTLTDVPTYDRQSADFPADIFKNSSYLVFIASAKNNPITSKTVIRFIAGSMATEPADKCSRLFLDDLYVYRINKQTDEDIFELNGSTSGRDRVLGGAAEN